MAIPKARPEHQVIFWLLNERTDQIEENLSSGIELDWDYILEVANEHSIVPFLYKRIRSIPDELIPSRSLEIFKERNKQIATYNFARTAQLIKLVRQLEEHAIPVIAYKGMALAEFAYKDPTQRQFGDIDLFIRKTDFPRVKKHLLKIGCKPAWDLSEKQENAVLKYSYEFPFVFGDINTLVEVHWEFVESFFSFDYEFDEVWDRTAAVELYGKLIDTLSAEDYLIILCSHGSKHFWKRLSWICDVAALVDNKQLSWKTVFERASKYGSMRMVLIGLFLSQLVFGAKLPGEILKKIDEDQNVKPLAMSFVTKVFKKEKEPEKWTEMAKIHLKMRENLFTKLTYSYRLVATKAIDSLFLPMGRPR